MPMFTTAKYTSDKELIAAYKEAIYPFDGRIYYLPFRPKSYPVFCEIYEIPCTLCYKFLYSKDGVYLYTLVLKLK